MIQNELKTISELAKTAYEEEFKHDNKESKMLSFAKDVVQTHLGYINTNAYATMVNSGELINVPVPANTLRKAVDRYWVLTKLT